MKIGIIGGGMTGLALAHRLAIQGHAVTVFERDKQLGGLATYHDYGRFFWDRFYHVILPSDQALIGFLEEIGLGKQLRWKATRTGYYVDQHMYSMSNTAEFLRFPLLGIFSKLRLALTVLYCSRINDWQRLEKITVEEWLIGICGRQAYEKFWQPLLLAKLGESYRRVSAVFIWSYIKRAFSARGTSAQKEQLGHVIGGYKTVFDRLEDLIRTAEGEIRTGVAVERILPLPDSGLSIMYDSKREHFDKVIFTGPVNVLQSVAADGLVQITRGEGEVEYLGVICPVLITRKPLVPFYVVNIADQRIPFTGVIGMSSVVDPQETGGLYITYFPKYVHSEDVLLYRSDDELRELLFAGTRLMFPQFRKQDVESVHINRAFKVQPLQVLNYSKRIPTIATQHKNFFVLNTSQFVNVTLNNNSVISHVNEFLKRFGTALERPSAFFHPVLSDQIAAI